MKHLPSIVAGVDFSSSSGQVLAHAAKLASAADCPLVAAHVISSSRIRDWEEGSGREAATAGRVREMTERLEEMAAECCGGMGPVIEVRIGRPSKVLADIVRERHADLLVLGAHDVSKRRLGSVAAHCARTVPADVLLLRDWQGRFFRRIAVCVDFSPSSAVSLARAVAVAEAHGASLEAIHVLYPPSRDPWGRALEQRMDADVSYDARVRERCRGRFEDFLKPFAERLAGMEFSSLVIEGESPAAAITAHVDAGDVDLTVMGSREGSWVADFVLGGNTERLLHDSSSSMLITRA